jgi:hypothetical protein
VFRKSLCAYCNNQRSQPFDRAYAEFADWITNRNVARDAGIDFRRIYGSDWEESQELMARYYAKHFGCRMVETGIPVPESLRAFLDSGLPMHDAHLGLVLNDEFHKDRRYRGGLILSGDLVYTDRSYAMITGIVQAAFLGPMGVRYQWWNEPPDGLDSFVGHPMPILNRFRTEEDVLTGAPARMKLAAQVKQAMGWVKDKRWRAAVQGEERDAGE